MGADRRNTTRFDFWQNFWISLAAVLAGNAIYYLVLWPVLPPNARHRINTIDVGLLIDFWVCLVIYGVLKLFIGRRKTRRAAQE